MQKKGPGQATPPLHPEYGAPLFSTQMCMPVGEFEMSTNCPHTPVLHSEALAQRQARPSRLPGATHPPPAVCE
jgi:hypothetical protein